MIIIYGSFYRENMNRSFPQLNVLLIITVLFTIVLTLQPAAASVPQQKYTISRGGALYDKWYAVLGKQPPDGNMPIWSRQTKNTRSGPDTWRCVSCHGWDYQGKDGAYRSGNNFTGFPGLLAAAAQKSTSQLKDALQGKLDPQHDFSNYLDDAAMSDLANFLKTALIDDNEYIEPVTLKAKNGDATHGKQLYDQACAECHGKDGKLISFRFEGIDGYLGALAALDPWRFLHKTRFGTPSTPMVIGYDLGWTPQDGRDVLMYAQSLPASQVQVPTQSPTTSPTLGVPVNNTFTRLRATFQIMTARSWIIVLMVAILVGILVLVFWRRRTRK